jgi:hypothetical protein
MRPMPPMDNERKPARTGKTSRAHGLGRRPIAPKTRPTPPAMMPARMKTQRNSPQVTSRGPMGVVSMALKTDSKVIFT